MRSFPLQPLTRQFIDLQGFVWLFLTYQTYWNSPTVQELEPKSQTRPLDARWHFASLITWGKKKPSPLDSRAVRKSSASQHGSQLVRQSCIPCSEVLNAINICASNSKKMTFSAWMQKGKGMEREEGKEFVMLNIPLPVPSQEVIVAPLLPL